MVMAKLLVLEYHSLQFLHELKIPLDHSNDSFCISAIVSKYASFYFIHPSLFLVVALTIKFILWMYKVKLKFLYWVIKSSHDFYAYFDSFFKTLDY